MANNDFLEEHLVIGGCGIGTQSAQEDTKTIFPNDLESKAPTAQEVEQMHEDAVKQKPTLDKAFDNESTTTDAETGEVTTTKTEEEKPSVKANENGTYQGIFLAPMNMEERIPAVLTSMAETDEELAKAIKEGDKTFKGCCRWLSNNMADLAREMKKKEITFDDDSVHLMARYYMVNKDCLDVQNAVKDVKKKKEPKPKAESKPKQEPKKGEDKTKIVPLTPQMGNLFGDDEF